MRTWRKAAEVDECGSTLYHRRYCPSRRREWDAVVALAQVGGPGEWET
jgi:hypothetical protein